MAQTATLRHAGLDDIPTIMEFAKKLYTGSAYSTLKLDMSHSVTQLENFIIQGNKDFLVLISHDNGVPVGVVAAYLFRPLFSSEKVTTEVLLWLEPEYRTKGRGDELLDAYEYWAKAAGASIAQYGLLSSADPRLASLYTRRGAVKVEEVYYKDLR